MHLAEVEKKIRRKELEKPRPALSVFFGLPSKSRILKRLWAQAWALFVQTVQEREEGVRTTAIFATIARLSRSLRVSCAKENERAGNLGLLTSWSRYLALTSNF